MGERTFIRHKRDKDEPRFTWQTDDWEPWKYQTEDGEELYQIPTTEEEISRWPYAKGYDQFGNVFHIDFPGSFHVGDELYQGFRIYPSDEDGYYEVNNRPYIAPWSDLYDPNSTVLPELEVYPKTAELILHTYPFFDPNAFISHSEAELVPTHWGGPSGYISKGMDAEDYNLFNNNCADGTCSVAEIATGKKAKRRLITTPAWIKKFLKENGGIEHRDGTVHLKLDEKTALAVEQAMKELNKKWGYE